MKDRHQLLKEIENKLKETGLGFDEIKVFGLVRCNVHVKCLSRNTAEKWSMVLGAMSGGSAVNIVKTHWNAKENKGTSMCPTKRKGYLVASAW